MLGMLIVDESLRIKIKKILHYAHENPVTEEALKKTVEGKIPPIGTSSPENVLFIPLDFRVVYSEEYQPIGLYRHLSVSVADKERKKLPHPIACTMILEEFGFRNKIPTDPKDWKPTQDLVVWLDEENNALNFLEKYAA